MALLTSEGLACDDRNSHPYTSYLSQYNPKGYSYIVETSKAILDIQGWHNIICIQCYWKYHHSIVVITRCCVFYDTKLTHVLAIDLPTSFFVL